MCTFLMKERSIDVKNRLAMDAESVCHSVSLSACRFSRKTLRICALVIGDHIELDRERVQYADKSRNEVGILLLKVEEVVDAFLQAPSGKQRIFYFFDLPQPVGVNFLFGLEHFLLNFFQAMQRALRFS